MNKNFAHRDFYILLVLIVFILNGISICKSVAQKRNFTEIKTSSLNYLSPAELMTIQYYNSHEVWFRTKTNQQVNIEKNISTGKITRNLVTTGKEKYLPAFTPGVAVEVTKDTIKVDFGAGIIIPFPILGYNYQIWYSKSSGKSETPFIIDGTTYYAEISNEEFIKSGEYVFNVNLLVDLSVTDKRKFEIKTETVTGKVLRK